MNKIMAAVMYVLWIVALVLIVSTTLMDFKYEDLNAMALLFFAFALLTTFFVFAKK